MKWFLITLAIGLAASDKLDRTYLPPPGAHLAGGILGSHDAPLKPPHHLHSGQGAVIPGQESQPNFGVNGEAVNFGDKIPKVPVTTTSYAFSQTTTYPPGEGFETTPLPINPVTGLPIQLEQGLQNFPYGPQGQQSVQNLPGYSQTLAPTYGTNIQPGLQGSTSAPINVGSPGYDQLANQPLNQYAGQKVITPGGASQIPSSVYPGLSQGELQYPRGQSNTPSQGFIATGAPDNQRLDQYPGQDLGNLGDVIQFPGGNQGLVQYPAGQTITGQQGFTPTTGFPINLQPGGNQNGVNYDGSQGSISQGTYAGQPINVPNLGGPQPTRTLLQNQEPINIGRPQSQYPSGKQNYGTTTGSENLYQPGSLSSTFPSSYNNRIPSTTALPGVPSSTTSYSSVGPVYRPERPQAAADRGAVILNYENIRTPNGYSYSFDTSNGIHADENGIVDNGTKAQGAYSYIGDDGKVYSVIYTADENGFQPRGDHLPTPPPVPEAIQRVIEQAARDKAAGIVHDGSYSEAKYGDHNYQENANHRRPQNQHVNLFAKDQFNRTQDDLIKPISGIKDEKYDDDEENSKDQFNNNLPSSDTVKGLNGKFTTTRPASQNGVQNGQDISKDNRRISGDFYSPKGDFDGNRMPIVEDEINQLNHYGTKKQIPAGRRPGSSGNNFSTTGGNDFNDNNLSGSKNRRPSERRPISGDAKDVSEKYPGSNVNVGATDKSGNAGEGIYEGEGQNIDFGNPNVADGPGENININYDSVTGAPMNENKKQKLSQQIKGNRRPVSAENRNTQNNSDRYQGETFTQDYYKKGNAHQPATQEGDTGYNYQQPNTKFEQNTSFPTRFNPQEAPSTTPDQRRTEYVEGTTRKPFMTPNVYHQNVGKNQTTTNVFIKNDRNSQTTTRRPYTTPFNTDDSYTDYDDGEYATEQDIGDDRIQSTRKPADKRITSRPYQSTQTTSRPQTVPGGQRTDVNKKGGSLGRRTENTGTESPGYTYGPTTQMPSQNSRFGNTEIARRMRPQERRPSTTVPDSTTAVGRPVTTQSPLATGQPDYTYHTTGPYFKYSSENIGSGYPTTGFFPGTGLMSTTSGVSTPQDYYTTTYRPSQGYYSTTAVPPTSGYIQGSDFRIPSSTPGSYQPTQDGIFHTGYHYGPPKSGSVNLDGPGFSTPTETSGVFPTSPSGPYQTTYQQGPNGFPSTTFVPRTSGKQGSLIPSQPGTFTPGTSPTGPYQENYRNGPSTPNYGTTIDSSTPGQPVFVYPGQTGATDTTGFEYGTTRPRFSTTDPPSTVGITPGSFIATGTTRPSQDYSTTYRPGFQSTEGTFVGGPVDGFGRPAVIDQGGLHPGFVYPTRGPSGPVTNVGPNFGSADQSNTYPGSYDQTRVIGEDFSGPKQPQRFDPKTGYHYK